MKNPNAKPLSRGSARALPPSRMEVTAAIPRPVGPKSSARALAPSKVDAAVKPVSGRSSAAARGQSRAE